MKSYLMLEVIENLLKLDHREVYLVNVFIEGLRKGAEKREQIQEV